MGKISKIRVLDINYPELNEQGPGIVINVEVDIENSPQKENFIAKIAVPVLPIGKISELNKWVQDYLREKGYAAGLPI